MSQDEGRVALVTGASRNIGRAIAEELAGQGIDIIVHVGRDQAAGKETAAAVRRRGDGVGLVDDDAGGGQLRSPHRVGGSHLGSRERRRRRDGPTSTSAAPTSAASRRRSRPT